MKLSSILLSFVLFVTFSYSKNISAHIIEESKNIQTTIHITSNDKPIANKESEITFEIKDSLDKFEFENCKCVVHISKNNTLIDSLDLYSNKLKYTFPEPGSFSIKLTASPDDSEVLFESFENIFVYEVFATTEKEPELHISPTNLTTIESSHNTNQNSYYIIASSAALFLGISLVAFLKNIKVL